MDDSVSYKSNFGFAIGGLIEIQLTNDVVISLQPVLLQKGTTIAYRVRENMEPIDSIKVNLTYFSFPLMVNVISGNGKTYVSGGVEFSIPIRGKKSIGNTISDIEGGLRSYDVALNFGFGVRIPVNSSHLIFELRYSQGLVNIIESEVLDFTPRLKNSSLQLYSGYLFVL